MEGSQPDEVLTLKGLSRVYHTNLYRQRRVAVNQLSLGVGKGEVSTIHCFYMSCQFPVLVHIT